MRRSEIEGYCGASPRNLTKYHLWGNPVWVRIGEGSQEVGMEGLDGISSDRLVTSCGR